MDHSVGCVSTISIKCVRVDIVLRIPIVSAVYSMEIVDGVRLMRSVMKGGLIMLFVRSRVIIIGIFDLLSSQ